MPEAFETTGLTNQRALGSARRPIRRRQTHLHRIYRRADLVAAISPSARERKVADDRNVPVILE